MKQIIWYTLLKSTLIWSQSCKWWWWPHMFTRRELYEGDLNQKERCGRNIRCDRPSLLSHITKTETLSSVYYTGIRGEIDLKRQLLCPVLQSEVDPDAVDGSVTGLLPVTELSCPQKDFIKTCFITASCRCIFRNRKTKEDSEERKVYKKG